MFPLVGEQLYGIIPQRAPIVMIDALQELSESGAYTLLTIREDNIFCSGGQLREPGLIEHVAQSAAAFAGYPNFESGLAPKLGYIGEIKRCLIHTLPAIGSTLQTHLTVMGEAAGVTLMRAETKVGDELVLECQMKIF